MNALVCWLPCILGLNSELNSPSKRTFSAYEYYRYDLLFNPYRFFQYFVELDRVRVPVLRPCPPPREPVVLVGTFVVPLVNTILICILS